MNPKVRRDLARLAQPFLCTSGVFFRLVRSRGRILGKWSVDHFHMTTRAIDHQRKMRTATSRACSRRGILDGAEKHGPPLRLQGPDLSDGTAPDRHGRNRRLNDRRRDYRVSGDLRDIGLADPAARCF